MTTTRTVHLATSFRTRTWPPVLISSLQYSYSYEGSAGCYACICPAAIVYDNPKYSYSYEHRLSLLAIY
eukprot:scaffold304143_cov13-Prasinocladus_malaysianus.AAC.1